MKRWLIRIIISAAVLLVLIAVAVQIVLSTDVPKNIVLDAIRKQTGLSVDASSLRTSWGGHTTLEDFEAALPLESDPFVRVRRVTVRHHSLIRLALTRSLGLSELRIVDPVVDLRTDPSEQWNLIEAAQIAAGARQPRDPADASVPDLPRLIIRNAEVNVALPDGRTLQYTPFEIHGTPDGPLAWNFTLTLEDRIAIDGRLAPGAGWAHRVEFDVDEVRSLIEPFVAELPEPLDASGVWTGDIRSGSLAGSLAIDTLHAGELGAFGRIDAALDGLDLRVQPSGLTVTQGRGAGALTVRLEQGTAVLSTTDLTLQKLTGRVEHIADFHASGAWSLESRSGTAELEWQSTEAASLTTAGSLSAQASRAPLGEARLLATVDTTGALDGTDWQISTVLNAVGESWQTMNAAAQIQQATVTREDASANFDGAMARATLNWPNIAIDEFTVPGRTGTSAQITGAFNAESYGWSIVASADEWRPRATIPSLPDRALSFDLTARGDRAHAQIDEFTSTYDGATARLSGRLGFEGELDSQLTFNAVAPDGLSLTGLRTERIDATGTATGTLRPLDLNIDATSTVQAVSYNDQPVGPLVLKMRAHADESAVELTIDPTTLLDGEVSATASFARGEVHIDTALSASGVSLARLGTLLRVPQPLSGLAGADIEATIPFDDPTSAVATGEWLVQEIQTDEFGSLSGEGTLRVGDGRLTLPEAVLRSGEGELRASAEMNLDQPDPIAASFRLADWPLELPEQRVSAKASAEGEVELLLSPLGASGAVETEVALRYNGQDAGTLRASTSLSPDDIRVTNFQLTTLDGQLTGTARFGLREDPWRAAHLDASWSELRLSSLRPFAPSIDDLVGTTSGSLTLQPATDPRATLPMELNIVADFVDASYAGFTIGRGDRPVPDLEAIAHFGPSRVEIREGKMTLADGRVDFYGRVTRHADETAAFVHLIMDRLDLQQIANAAKLDDRPMPGRVSGDWSVGGVLEAPHRLYGGAQLSLTESDLLALPGIAQVYSALRLDIGSTKPEGEGEAVIRLEGGALEIARLNYFNRGTDVLAGLRIDNIFDPRTSPISGSAVGAARPLKGTRASFLEVVDRAIRAAQSNAVAVEIGGTLSEPTSRIVPLKDLTSSIGRLLKGRPK
ncbi:MAG: hypothetical protein ABL309_10795 [Phycisphaerales bacterium]